MLQLLKVAYLRLASDEVGCYKVYSVNKLLFRIERIGRSCLPNSVLTRICVDP